jgi:hypothetical protein
VPLTETLSNLPVRFVRAVRAGQASLQRDLPNRTRYPAQPKSIQNLSEDALNTLIALYAGGASLSASASAVGIWPQRARRELQNAGVVTKPAKSTLSAQEISLVRQYLGLGWTAERIAPRVPCSPERVRRWMRAQGIQ